MPILSQCNRRSGICPTPAAPTSPRSACRSFAGGGGGGGGGADNTSIVRTATFASPGASSCILLVVSTECVASRSCLYTCVACASAASCADDTSSLLPSPRPSS